MRQPSELAGVLGQLEGALRHAGLAAEEAADLRLTAEELRALTDRASYHRSGGCKILVLTRRLPGRVATGQGGNREKE